jgi:hypothetical protein
MCIDAKFSVSLPAVHSRMTGDDHETVDQTTHHLPPSCIPVAPDKWLTVPVGINKHRRFYL